MNNWTLSEANKANLVLTEGNKLVKSEKLVSKKVKKIVPSTSTFDPCNLILDIREDTPVVNRKIKNAKKSVNAEGVKFDSRLEKYMYDLLKGANIEFEFQKVYQLQAPFRYNGEAVRAITKVVDFWLPTRNMIIDTKGFSNDVSPLKHKMLKRILLEQFKIHYKNFDSVLSPPQIEMPKNRKECGLLLNRLLYDK